MPSLRGLTLAMVAISLLATLAFSQAGTTTLSSPPTIQSYCFFTNGTTTLSNCIFASLPLAFLGILLSFALIAVSYMAGEVLNIGGLKGFYRKELWEASKSIMLIAIVYSVILIMGGIALSFTGSIKSGAGCTFTSNYGGGGNQLGNLYNGAEYYLCDATQNVTTSFSALLGLSLGVGATKSVNLGVWSPVPIYIPPDEIIGSLQSGSQSALWVNDFLVSIQVLPTYSFLNALVKLVNGLLVLFIAQKDLLPLIVNTGIGILLPIGIFLRALPFVRGIGGAFVAMGIGMAVVYPALLVTMNLPITNFIEHVIPTPSSGEFSCSSGVSPLICIAFNLMVNLFTNPTQGCVGKPTACAAVGTSLTYLLGPNQITPQALAAGVDGFNAGFFNSINSIYPAINLSVNYALQTVVQFMLMVFDLVLGVIILQNIARMLGGQIRLSMGKMKLA